MSKSHGITCKKCGVTGLAWATAKSGKHYLAHVIRRANVSDEFIPHFKSCVGSVNAERAARNEAILAERAEREAKLQAMFAAGDYEGMQRLVNGG
jgi:hypothetical protein